MFEPMDFFFGGGLLQQNQNFSNMAGHAITFPYTSSLLTEATYLYKG